MKVLVANLGSTSFKYKLYALEGAGERVLAEGEAEKLGASESPWSLQAGDRVEEGTAELADHGAAIALHLEKLSASGALAGAADLDAVGFKAVHGGPISGAVPVDDEVIATMERFADVAPQHNPPYVAAMRGFAERLPGVPQVAAFETAFHQTIPLERQAYGVPYAWLEEHGIRRYGFHGASHRYVGMRMAELAPDARRVINCHLGGSCSVSGLVDGASAFNSFGMTAQSGVFHGGRVGDLDVFALRKLLEAGHDLESIFHTLGKESGLKGLSGVSSDMQAVQAAAAGGDERARLAVSAFVEHVRHHIGAAMMATNGADALVFTGGIGQHDPDVRARAAAGLGFAGLTLDGSANASAPGDAETRIDDGSGNAIWVLPTNEELVVARQTAAVLRERDAGS